MDAMSCTLWSIFAWIGSKWNISLFVTDRCCRLCNEPLRQSKSITAAVIFAFFFNITYTLFVRSYFNDLTIICVLCYFQVDVQSCGVDSLSDSNHVQSTSQYNLANYIKVVSVIFICLLYFTCILNINAFNENWTRKRVHKVAAN